MRGTIKADRQRVRVVIKWPPGLLDHARAAGGGRLSGFAVKAALAITPADHDLLRQFADELSRVAQQQVAVANRARVLRGRLDEDHLVAAELAATQRDLVPFVPDSVQVSDPDVEAVSAAAAAAGFARHDEKAVMGNPNAGQSRSFTAYLRAAVALVLAHQQVAEALKEEVANAG